MGFTPYWDHKAANAIHAYSPGAYTSENILDLSSQNKNHLNFDVINGSVVNGVRESILFSFVLDKPPGYKVFCEPKTVQIKQRNKSVLNTLTFYLEDYSHKEVSFFE